VCELNRILYNIGKIFTGKNYSTIKQDMAYANLKYDPYEWVGLNAVIGMICTVAVFLIVLFFTNDMIYSAVAIVLTLVCYYLFVSTIVTMFADRRARYAEEVLPDALLLMASNLRSGLPTDEAITLSSRPEFGFMADKINDAGKGVATGETFADAFKRISKDINSTILNKTVGLVIEGLESGGEIATLLEETAVDIRDNDLLQREIRSVILVYALFIFIAAVVTAPILYAISTHLAGALSRLSTAISVSFLTKNAPTINFATSEISPDFLFVFSIVNLLITSILGSLMVSLITTGNEKYGIRYIPVFIAVSLAIFFVVRYLVSGFFSSIVI
jgi:hypothetical protein